MQHATLEIDFVYMFLIWPSIFILCHSLSCFHLIKEWLLENLLTSV